MQNFFEIGQAMPEILKALVNPRWRLGRHLGSNSKAKKHIQKISMASMPNSKRGTCLLPSPKNFLLGLYLSYGLVRDFWLRLRLWLGYG